jgi:hypothetical protein
MIHLGSGQDIGLSIKNKMVLLRVKVLDEFDVYLKESLATNEEGELICHSVHCSTGN